MCSIHEAKPILTVITVCFNVDSCIEKTIKSLLQQKCSGIEYLVIDGASTDNTVSILSKYKKLFAARGISYKVISEPDNGLYDAMNKGIKHAKGEWIQYLNAGDDYNDNDVLSRVICILEESEADIVCGNYVRISEDGNIIRPWKVPEFEGIKTGMIFGHESCFIRREKHKKFPYNIKYTIEADYNSFLGMYLDGYKIQHIDMNIINFYEDGVSSKRRIEAVRQIYICRYKHGLIKPTIFNKLYIKLYICAWKVIAYYYILPKKMIRKWEEYKMKNNIYR